MARVRTTNLQDLAEAFGGSTTSSFQVNEGNTNNSSISVSGSSVQFGGAGIAGTGVVSFSSSEEAEKFHDFLEDARELGILDEILSADSFNWNDLANAAGATRSRELVSKVNEDNLWDNAVREFENDQGDWIVKITGQGVGGFADAKFDDQADALIFSDMMETLVDIGLSDSLFEL